MATADALVTAILARCFWPSSNAPLTSAEILSFADATIVGSMWPEILATQGDYFVSTEDHTITADYSRYRLPEKAYGPIKDVLYIASGDDDDEEQPVPLINLEQVGQVPVNGKFASFIEGDFLGLYPTPTETAGTLRIRYYRHPSALCLATAARQITGVTSLENGQFAGSTLTTLWTTASTIDIVSKGNAHQVLAHDLAITSVSASAIDFATSLTGSGAVVSDWLCTAGTTPIVQVPDSMIPMLAYQTALTCLGATGDRQGIETAMAVAKELGLNTKQKNMLEPRSESAPRAVDTQHSTLFSGRGRTRRWA